MEVLADDQMATMVASLSSGLDSVSRGSPACGGFSENGSSCRSGRWRNACRALDLKPFRITACSRRPHGMSTDGSEPMPRHPQHHPWGKLPDSRRRQASQQEPGETSELMPICPHRARLAHLRITCASLVLQWCGHH